MENPAHTSAIEAWEKRLKKKRTFRPITLAAEQKVRIATRNASAPASPVLGMRRVLSISCPFPGVGRDQGMIHVRANHRPNQGANRNARHSFRDQAFPDQAVCCRGQVKRAYPEADVHAF